jgi:four helix bundle protein
MFKSFKEMPIWQKALEVAEDIHKLTRNLPRSEDYGFTSQIRRSALSISANIAEAFGRNHKRDKINFYYVSRGSATETQSHLEYAKRVGYVDSENAATLDRQLTDLYNSINKVIAALRDSNR